MKRILFYIATLVVIFPTSNAIFGQTAPALNSADSFVLFTGNGNFTCSSPFTIVVGNVGNKTGTVTGFPCGFLSGAAHFNDATATQVAADITTAYADLAGRTCGPSHGTVYGSETLAPGVHCTTTGNATLSGTLTLDGGGNSSAVFIIKIDGNFLANAGSQIVLLNGATSCNVFFQINGTVDLNNTTFRGTIVANQAVNLTNGTIVEGRVLTKSGAFTFGPFSGIICNPSLLPLNLIDFEVTKATGDNVQVSWITTSEVNVSRYEVEASVNGSPFVKMGTVAAQGNDFPTRYNFQDLQANKTGVRFYRLKMIDKDDAFTYSFVRSLKFSDLKLGLGNIFPNPASNKITISVNAEAKENLTITIADMQGQKVFQKTRVVNKGLNSFTEDIHNLIKATYIVSIKNITTGEEIHQNLQKL